MYVLQLPLILYRLSYFRIASSALTLINPYVTKVFSREQIINGGSNLTPR